ncbi:MAG: two-component system, OmpR family, sensor kinase, partial [Gaiellales bacterium]|nr:two-component system, OmpR family, sensor kinase [Gaiellales bacterium]
MNLRSLRVRVGFAAALSILVALAVLGSTLVVLLGRQLHDELDRALRTRATEVAQLVATTPALVTQPGALEAPLGGQQLFVEVLDRHRRIVARSSALGAKVLSVPDAQRQALAGRSARTSVRLGDTPLRVLAAPLSAGSGTAAGGVVLVAASTRSIDATIAEARRLLVLSALAAAVVAGLVAAGLARRALRPLSQLSAGVREITRTSDPTRRLPEPATGDELGELAGTLNTMLGALTQARERERRFVADASHELRTPLTALRGNAEHIARHGADSEALADLAAGAERLSRLIDDLLVLAREDSAAPPTATRVALAEVAGRVAGREPLVDLEIRADAQTSGDQDALERAVSNLVENARLHGPAGGRIRVTVDVRDGVSE